MYNYVRYPRCCAIKRHSLHIKREYIAIAQGSLQWSKGTDDKMDVLSFIHPVHVKTLLCNMRLTYTLLIVVFVTYHYVVFVTLLSKHLKVIV